MSGDLSEEDVAFLKGILKEGKAEMINSQSLSKLLEAYQNIERAFVSELPLELALIKILSVEK